MNAMTTHLIIGCGYLGERLHVLLNDQPCWVTNRSMHPDNSDISNIYSFLFDINDENTWSNLNVLSDKRDLIIYLMVPPGKIDLAIFPEFINQLNKLDTHHCILISSTVVYGNTNRVVDADSEVEIDSERAKRQYQIEQLWLTNLGTASVVRLAGIYGPERIVGLNGIIRGEMINGDPDGWLNLIHVNDAASLLKRISEIDQVEQIELGCDGTPIKRKEYYNFLAKRLNQPLPVFNQDGPSRGTGRRCDNKLTISRTGW